MTPTSAHRNAINGALPAGAGNTAPAFSRLVMVEVNRSGVAIPMLFIPNHAEYNPPVDNYPQVKCSISRNVFRTDSAKVSNETNIFLLT